MRKQKFYTFDEHLKESLKDPDFRKAWEETEPEYQLARQLIEKRIAKKMSQRDLAKKVKTSQAIICRIEGMNYNPSLALLKRIAQSLGSRLEFKLK